MNRITRSTDTSTGALDVRSFTYDEVGNRTSETRNGALTTYNYASNANNRLTSLSGAATDAFTYDANGFITSHTAPSKSVSYAYDAQNRLRTLRDELSAPGTVGPAASVTFTYLAVGCGSANISFTINGTPAATVAASDACTCTPGVRSVTVTDPVILELLTNGRNTFGVTFPQYLAWAVATVDGNDFVIYDAGGGGDAEARRPDLCASGADYNAGEKTSTTPSVGSLTFSWLATSCGSSQPITFSINNAVAYTTMANADCTCSPGIGTFKTSDPAVLGLLHAGVNTVSVSFTHHLAWAVVTVEDHGDIVVYDAAGRAASRDPNLCAGYGTTINATANSPDFVAQHEVTYTYDGFGRIWERKLRDGRFTQLYYDTAGRITQEKEYRGESANGAPVYVITDFVYAGELLVTKLVRKHERTAGGTWRYVDSDVQVIAEDLRAPRAIESVFAHPGLSWEANTDVFGNWHNLGSRHEHAFAGGREQFEKTVSNLSGHSISRIDPSDWLTTGLDHGSSFKMSDYDRLGGPSLDGQPDAGSYMANQIADTLGQIGGFHAGSQGAGPDWSFRAPKWAQVGAGKLCDGEDPCHDDPEPDGPPSDPSEWHQWDEPPTPRPSVPSDALPPSSTPGSGSTGKWTSPDVNQLNTAVNNWMDNRTKKEKAGIYGAAFILNSLRLGGTSPYQMCNPDAMGEGCEGDSSSVTGTGKPRVRGDWVARPIHPDFASHGGTPTLATKKPGAVDPIEPQGNVYVNFGAPDVDSATCKLSYLACGGK